MTKIIDILRGTDTEQGDYFAKKHKKNIKVGSTDEKYGFVWNKKMLLWQEYSDDECAHMVTDFFRKKFNKQMEEDKQDLTLDKLRRKVTSYKYSATVWKSSKAKIIDKDFRGKLNKNPDLLPIMNGKLINLKTGEIRDRKRSDYFSFECSVDYLKDDKLKHAKKFISDICGGDKKYAKYLTKYLGYCLTGQISDRGFAQFFGVGKNGKSKLVDMMQLILGRNKFFASLSNQVFVKSNSSKNGASPHLLPLQYARMAVYAESGEGDHLNVSVVNAISGGDEIVARDLYKSEVRFYSQSKLAIMTNHPLKFNASDKAILDRLRHFPFLQNFVNKKKGEDLEANEKLADDKFIEEMRTKYLNEFFTLLVKKGSMKWYKKKSFAKKPKVAQEALKEYIGDLDYIQQFIDECCDVGEDKKFKKSLFNKEFSDWFKTNNFKSMPNVGAYMKKKFKLKQGTETSGDKGIISYVGVGHKSNTTVETDED